MNKDISVLISCVEMTAELSGFECFATRVLCIVSHTLICLYKSFLMSIVHLEN